MCRHSAAFPQSRDRHGREGNNLINTCGINFSITVLPIPPTHLPLHTPPPSFIPTLRYANEHVRLAHRPQPSRQIVCCDDERKTVGKNGCPDSSFRLAWRGNVQQLPACNGGQERNLPESHHPQKLEIFSLLVRQYHCSYAVEVSCAVLLAANYTFQLLPLSLPILSSANLQWNLSTFSPSSIFLIYGARGYLSKRQASRVHYFWSSA